jgi:hypothetical protein
VNVHNDDNHEPIQLFEEVVYVQQPWWSKNLGYNLPKTSASTPIITFVNFQNQPSHTNIHLVPTNLEMEQLHLINNSNLLIARVPDSRLSLTRVLVSPRVPGNPQVADSRETLESRSPGKPSSRAVPGNPQVPDSRETLESHSPGKPSSPGVSGNPQVPDSRETLESRSLGKPSSRIVPGNPPIPDSRETLKSRTPGKPSSRAVPRNPQVP